MDREVTRLRAATILPNLIYRFAPRDERSSLDHRSVSFSIAARSSHVVDVSHWPSSRLCSGRADIVPRCASAALEPMGRRFRLKDHQPGGFAPIWSAGAAGLAGRGRWLRFVPADGLKLRPVLVALRLPRTYGPFQPNLRSYAETFIGEAALEGNVPTQEDRPPIHFWTDRLGFRLNPFLRDGASPDLVVRRGVPLSGTVLHYRTMKLWPPA